jgi:pimeloyl-ACP methyl ester carboxylesterase
MIEDWKKNRRIGVFGKEGENVVVLHGGPAGYGGSDSVAKELSKKFKTYSPWHRRSGDVPLTVDLHVEDLKEFIEMELSGVPTAIVGESWGAMLALALACKYPDKCKCLALVGCGSYKEEIRNELQRRRQKRIENHIEEHPEFKDDLKLSRMEQLFKWHNMTDTFALRDSFTANSPEGEFDKQAFDETWNDMLRCQKEHIYPERFVNITCPVIMLHGAYDPHPGTMIAEHLKSFIPQLEYKEFSRCGHAPDIEKYARDAFYEFLFAWLEEKTRTGPKE